MELHVHHAFNYMPEKKPHSFLNPALETPVPGGQVRRTRLVVKSTIQKHNSSRYWAGISGPILDHGKAYLELAEKIGKKSLNLNKEDFTRFFKESQYYKDDTQVSLLLPCRGSQTSNGIPARPQKFSQILVEVQEARKRSALEE